LFRWLPIMTSWRKVLIRWLPIRISWRKDKQSWMLRWARIHSWQWLLRNLSVSCRVNHFFCCNYSYVVHTEYIYIFSSTWTLRMSDNLVERVKILGHAHILYITVQDNRIICCQIFCDLLLKFAFEWIFNVMQLILVKIKWHIKWKYLIQKFHDICLSYYFNYNVN
jgi:hypothetical protein